MLILRPIELRDLDDLVNLAGQLDSMNLPSDRGFLETRIQASRAYDLGTVEMIELHGGVGYTWEYDCHLYYRRAKLLSTTLGSVASWKERLVSRIEASDAA